MINIFIHDLQVIKLNIFLNFQQMNLGSMWVNRYVFPLPPILENELSFCLDQSVLKHFLVAKLCSHSVAFVWCTIRFLQFQFELSGRFPQAIFINAITVFQLHSFFLPFKLVFLSLHLVSLLSVVVFLFFGRMAHF